MAADRPITPAPKPSARKRTTASKAGSKAAPAKGDTAPAKPEDTAPAEAPTTVALLTDPDQRKQLIESPDGTPGKAEALRVEAAAPIVTQAVKGAREWVQIDGKAATLTKAHAQELVQLRRLWTDQEGRPDMRGNARGYRDVAAQIYLQAGFDEDKTKKFRDAVRYHLGDMVRAVLRDDPEFAGGDEQKYTELCAYYDYNPLSQLERQNQRRGYGEGNRRETKLPELKLPPNADDIMWPGVTQYASKALAIPGDADPTTLPEDAQDKLRKELRKLRNRVNELLQALGDADE